MPAEEEDYGETTNLAATIKGPVASRFDGEMPSEFDILAHPETAFTQSEREAAVREMAQRDQAIMKAKMELEQKHTEMESALVDEQKRYQRKEDDMHAAINDKEEEIQRLRDELAELTRDKMEMERQKDEHLELMMTKRDDELAQANQFRDEQFAIRDEQFRKKTEEMEEALTNRVLSLCVPSLHVSLC